jgi:hypothetical protein
MFMIVPDAKNVGQAKHRQHDTAGELSAKNSGQHRHSHHSGTMYPCFCHSDEKSNKTNKNNVEDGELI